MKNAIAVAISIMIFGRMIRIEDPKKLSHLQPQDEHTQFDHQKAWRMRLLYLQEAGQ